MNASSMLNHKFAAKFPHIHPHRSLSVHIQGRNDNFRRPLSKNRKKDDSNGCMTDLDFMLSISCLPKNTLLFNPNLKT